VPNPIQNTIGNNNAVTLDQYIASTIEEFNRQLNELISNTNSPEDDRNSYSGLEPTGEAMGLAFSPTAGVNNNMILLSHFILPEQPLNASTLCLWMKATCWNEYNLILFINQFTLGLNEGTLYVYLNPTYEAFNLTSVLHQWIHFCLIITESGFDLFHNGQKVETTKYLNSDAISKDEIPSGFVNITLSTSDYFFGLCGYLADPWMFPRALTLMEINDIRSGKATEIRPQGSKLTVDFISSPQQENVITSFSYSELLKPNYNFILFVSSSKLTYFAAVEICSGYGGTLPTLEHQEHKQMLLEYMLKGGLTFDIWIELSNWTLTSEYQDGMCPMINSIYRDELTFLRWPCNKTCMVFHCFVPRIQYVTLKGKGVGSDNTFVITEDYRGSGRIALEGLQERRGQWNGHNFQIKTTFDEVLYEKSSEKDHIIGRQEWHNLKYDTKLNLSLSTCSHDEFSCGNGECIPLSLRCDGINGDCRDYTDDDTSCMQFLGPPKTYSRLTSPLDARVSVSIDLASVRSINVNEDRIQVVLGVTLRWRDERLVFYDLRQNGILPNLLPEECYELIWYPFLQIQQAEFDDNRRLATGKNHYNINLFPRSQGTVSQIDSYEAYMYKGREVDLQINLAVYLSFRCPFDLAAFPFDVQICLLTVELQGPGKPEINIEDLNVTGGDTLLPAYRMASLRCKPATKEPVSSVELAILLERRGEAFLKSAIGPCLILGLLGHLSFLAFPVDEFNERASTSLSLLIVVASLFSQSVSSLPESATSKAIDEWFFYFILRFFLFFLAQCVVEYQRRRLIKRQKSQVTQDVRQALIADNLGMKNSSDIKMRNEALDRIMEYPVHKSISEMGPENHVPLQGGWTQRQSPHDNLSLVQTSRVNMACFALGIVMDCLFVLIFCYNINSQNSSKREEFASYHLCFIH
ncbi:hypothetical protein SK128_020039, partial [Halocaridina rubra]